jgi:hypothetical protein
MEVDTTDGCLFAPARRELLVQMENLTRKLEFAMLANLFRFGNPTPTPNVLAYVVVRYPSNGRVLWVNSPRVDPLPTG